MSSGDGWVRVAAAHDFDGRDVIGVACEGRRVALYRLADGIFATSDTCPHLGASLSEGCVVEGFIECPQHHALFDIRTGVADGAVTDRPIQTFPTRVEGGEVYVDLAPIEETGR